MGFLLGLLVGNLFSKGSNHPNVGGIFLEPLGDHSTNPFAAQDAFLNSMYGIKVKLPLKTSYRECPACNKNENDTHTVFSGDCACCHGAGVIMSPKTKGK